ncbi:MAG: M48 family metallopeptidase [Candidatus Campbellbacteria bacterium]|nr:M48 family metallopeptidase [Candidatus Campbellbacteria bacterium]
MKSDSLVLENGKKLTYFWRVSNRARRIRIEVQKNGRVTIILPNKLPHFFAKRFAKRKEGWILKKLFLVKDLEDKTVPKYSKADYLKKKEEAGLLISERVEFFNSHYNFSYNQVRIKNQKTRWGSCSSKKNLNFSYKVIYLPPRLRDYIVVHELCHLRELNHSSEFWALVGEIFPDHKILRRKLKEYSLLLTG